MLCSWISHCYMNIVLSYVRLQKSTSQILLFCFYALPIFQNKLFWISMKQVPMTIYIRPSHPTTKYEDSHITLNFDSLTAVIEGTATSFTPLEFKLLKLLSLNPNTVLTRQHLLYSL